MIKRCRHSTFGQISPAAFERQAAIAIDAAGAVDAQNAPTPWKPHRMRFSTAYSQSRYWNEGEELNGEQFTQTRPLNWIRPMGAA